MFVIGDGLNATKAIIAGAVAVVQMLIHRVLLYARSDKSKQNGCVEKCWSQFNGRLAEVLRLIGILIPNGLLLRLFVVFAFLVAVFFFKHLDRIVVGFLVQFLLLFGPAVGVEIEDVAVT